MGNPIPPLVDELVALAERAGEAIMAVYEGGDMGVEVKSDDSPLTAADRASHEVIAEGLKRLTPHIPVLSEEGRDIPADERRGWEMLWVVDPLDGTKEFIKRNGEFTVNIALVEGGRTLWGVVHAPALGTTYWGGREFGAVKKQGDGQPGPIQVKRPVPGQGLAVVKSRSHPSPELAQFLKDMNIAEEVSVGSSLKFLAVAEGRAHMYPRLGPTMEWDTAAGQAVVEGAGGRVVTPEGEPFTYNKENLLNGYFIVDAGEGGA